MIVKRFVAKTFYRICDFSTKYKKTKHPDLQSPQTEGVFMYGIFILINRRAPKGGEGISG